MIHKNEELYINLSTLTGKAGLVNTYLSNSKSNESYFGPISHINILIGPNNSGKSRLLRSLIQSSELDITVKYKKPVDNISAHNDILKEKRIYIPVLRGMRPLILDSYDSEEIKKAVINKNFYMIRTNRDYKIKDSFTGLDFYTTLTEKLLGNLQDREQIKEYELFLSKEFFSNDEITLIPKYGEDTVYIKIGKDPDLPIYHLGDGIQQVIIITFPIFTENEPKWFLIEEPELYMHPGLQRQLLNVLLNKTEHKFFLTTHSNHLLDLTFDFTDISIFLIRREIMNEKTIFRINNISNNDINILYDLGVRSSSVMLTNASIWVEGITDRLYLRQYLNKYIEEAGSKEFRTFKEDKHYSFFEYQGSNLIHWEFDQNSKNEKIKANYITKNVLLIADGDIENKSNRKDEYQKILGEDKIYILPCKEIENLVPEEILKKVMNEILDKNGEDKGPIENIKYKNYCSSTKSIKIGLGKYLDKLFNKENQFGTDSGTIKNKLSFCQKCCEIMNDEEIEWSLTEPIKELCKKILDFISAQNK